jgi:hypothetical protein
MEGEIMRKLGDLTEEELELLVEQKILEILGDPDYGLALREQFKERLKERLQDPAKMAHEEVVKRFGEG